MFENPSQEKINDYLQQARTIAIVGLSQNEDRVSFQIARLLQESGYTIIPINPIFKNQKILGEHVYGCLQEVPFPIDIVNIYRKNEFLPEIAKDFIQSKAKVFWSQLDLKNETAAKLLQENGYTDIVMNLCIKVELAKLKKDKI